MSLGAQLVSTVRYVEGLRVPSQAGGDGGGGSGASTRAPVNLDAVDALGELERLLGPLLAFTEERGELSHRLLTVLRERGSVVFDIESGLCESVMEFVDARFHAPRTVRPLRFSCPVCGAGADASGVWALKLDVSALEASCGSCEAVWEREGLVELAEEVGLMDESAAADWMSRLA